MNFGFSEDQELLREQARRFVQERWPLSRVRGTLVEPASPYAEMAELGWCGLLVPEGHGGAGLSWVDAIVVLEATGAGLLPGPLASSLLASAAIAEYGNPEQRARWLPGLSAGARVGALALVEADGALDAAAVQLTGVARGAGYALSGDKAHVNDGRTADLIVTAARLPAGLSLVVLERQPGLTVEDQPLIDRTKQTAHLRLSDAEVPASAVLVEGAAAQGAFERLCDLGALAVTAEMLGAARAVHALTVEYAKTRHQFGRPIGQYQGVKHPLAEMHVDIETFRSLLYYAAWVADHRPGELSRAASMAKAYASDAFARIAIDAIQLHGAIGYTAEYDAQLYLKRSKWARAAFGDADHHYERVYRLSEERASDGL